ncbi:hypothetical protein NQ317_014794, partial [Molorchus minor]
AATRATLDLLPTKSKKQYELAYKRFVEWCDRNNVAGKCSENVMLAYFEQNSKIQEKVFDALGTFFNDNSGVNNGIMTFIETHQFQLLLRAAGYKISASTTQKGIRMIISFAEKKHDSISRKILKKERGDIKEKLTSKKQAAQERDMWLYRIYLPMMPSIINVAIATTYPKIISEHLKTKNQNQRMEFCRL